MVSAKVDITGRRFGRWTVIKDSGQRIKTRVLWECHCDCGTVKLMPSNHLLKGRSLSCGCLRNELSLKRHTSHGLSKQKIYRIWGGIVARCHIPSQSGYKRYGGRGISVCDEWRKDFVQFYNWAIQNGYREDLTIERVDCNGDYSPQNCKWIPRSEQCNNTRQSHFITIDGKTLTIKQWSKEIGISDKVIRCRLRHGWNEHDAVMVPKMTGRERYEKRGLYCRK